MNSFSPAWREENSTSLLGSDQFFIGLSFLSRKLLLCAGHLGLISFPLICS